MKKNLIICDIPWYSGLSSYAFDVAQTMLAWGEEVYWATGAGTILWERLSEIQDIRRIGIINRSSWSFFKNVKNIKNSLPQHPDRILCFTGNSFSIGHRLKKKYIKNSTLIRFRTESMSVKKSIFNRHLYNTSDLVIVGNKHIKRDLQSLGANNIEVVYAGVDSDKFVPGSFPEQVTFGFLGRLDHVKGLDILHRAMNKVWKKYSLVKLNIAGQQVNVKWSHLSSKFKGPVEYHGYLSDSEIPGFLIENSIGLIPSTDSEATSRCLLEWWASGRGVIASSVGVIPELMDPGRGFLVSSGDPEILAEKITQIIENPDSISALGASGRDFIERELSLNKFSEKLKQILNG